MTKRTYTIKIDGETYLNTIDYNLCLKIAQSELVFRKNVTVIDNAKRKVIARFIYGHKQ